MNMNMNWAHDSISKACITRPWAELVDTINNNIKHKVISEGYSRFSELSEEDQALLIEREFHEVSFCGFIYCIEYKYIHFILYI